MIVFPLIFGCIQQETNNQFGVAASPSEERFENEDAPEPEDSSAEDLDTALNSTAFSVDSSTVCGDRTVGTEVGNCALNFALLNQHSELVELHSFMGSVIFLDLSDFT